MKKVMSTCLIIVIALMTACTGGSLNDVKSNDQSSSSDISSQEISGLSDSAISEESDAELFTFNDKELYNSKITLKTDDASLKSYSPVEILHVYFNALKNGDTKIQNKLIYLRDDGYDYRLEDFVPQSISGLSITEYEYNIDLMIDSDVRQSIQAGDRSFMMSYIINNPTIFDYISGPGEYRICQFTTLKKQDNIWKLDGFATSP